MDISFAKELEIEEKLREKFPNIKKYPDSVREALVIGQYLSDSIDTHKNKYAEA